jgi:hypothetical protein
MNLLMAVLIIILFGISDFVTGRDYFARAHLPGRSIWYVAPALATALYFTHPSLAWVGLAWGLWRGVLGWSSFGGRMDCRTASDAAKMLARDVAGMVFVIPALVYGAHAGLVASLASMAAFCVFATAVNVWFGFEASRGHDVDPPVDALHGLGFGLALVSVLATS